MLREEEDHVFWAILSYDGVIKEDLSPIRLDKAIALQYTCTVPTPKGYLMLSSTQNVCCTKMISHVIAYISCILSTFTLPKSHLQFKNDIFFPITRLKLESFKKLTKLNKIGQKGHDWLYRKYGGKIWQMTELEKGNVEARYVAFVKKTKIFSPVKAFTVTFFKRVWKRPFGPYSRF